MATLLFNQIVYGPIHSRRLGASLGVNISPADGKRCTFNCIYCECGLNENFPPHTQAPKRTEVQQALENRLLQIVAAGDPLDVITFSGNGEPTMHPEFAGIIDDTLALRDRLCPNVRVAVLSNSTMVYKEPVFQALCRVDENIMKLDSAINMRMKQIDDPEVSGFTCESVIQQLCRFQGKLIIQTIFLRGERDGIVIDNTGNDEIMVWIQALKQINPYRVMIYTIDRETPVKSLQKIPKHEMEAIAERVRKEGFDVQFFA
ncbi:MAG: radical SAM protein [Tannerella sp.]|jgi:wyosine [tRNA(Phe)-imidazoG37] synthetase (radical SAM superfamily)|nr:radical SAM protein [Tannerella sp.]